MDRQLDPSIFGDAEESDRDGLKRPDMRYLEDFEGILKKLREENRALHQTNQQLHGTMKEQVKLNQIRFQKVSEKFAAMEKRFSQLAQAQTERVSELKSQIREQRLFDEKIKHMIGRHNQIVQNFESRLEQLGKQLREREVQLASARDELRARRRDI